MVRLKKTFTKQLPYIPVLPYICLPLVLWLWQGELEAGELEAGRVAGEVAHGQQGGGGTVRVTLPGGGRGCTWEPSN